MRKPIIPKAHEYVYALHQLGFTSYQVIEGEIVINNQFKDRIMDAVIRTDLRDADFPLNRRDLNDVITILAHAGADLEKRENIPAWMNPFGPNLKGHSPGPENRGSLSKLDLAQEKEDNTRV
jgi:hypothetical protein